MLKCVGKDGQTDKDANHNNITLHTAESDRLIRRQLSCKYPRIKYITLHRTLNNLTNIILLKICSYWSNSTYVLIIFVNYVT